MGRQLTAPPAYNCGYAKEGDFMGRQCSAPPAGVTPSTVLQIMEEASTKDLGGFPLTVEPFDLSLGNRMGRQLTAPPAVVTPSSVSKISQQGSTQDLGGFPLHVEPFD